MNAQEAQAIVNDPNFVPLAVDMQGTLFQTGPTLDDAFLIVSRALKVTSRQGGHGRWLNRPQYRIGGGRK